MPPAALVLGRKTNAAERGLPWRAGVFWRRKDDTHPRCVQVFLVVKKVSVTATCMSTTRRCQKRAVARDIRAANTEVLAEVQAVLGEGFLPEGSGFWGIVPPSVKTIPNPDERMHGLWTEVVASAKCAACE